MWMFGSRTTVKKVRNSLTWFSQVSAQDELGKEQHMEEVKGGRRESSAFKKQPRRSSEEERRAGKNISLHWATNRHLQMLEQLAIPCPCSIEGTGVVEHENNSSQTCSCPYLCAFLCLDPCDKGPDSGGEE